MCMYFWMHACDACMHVMHACILCMHACYACMHTMHACMLCMHAYYACMHAYNAFMHAYYACMHATHACILCSRRFAALRFASLRVASRRVASLRFASRGGRHGHGHGNWLKPWSIFLVHCLHFSMCAEKQAREILWGLLCGRNILCLARRSTFFMIPSIQFGTKFLHPIFASTINSS